LSSPQRDVVTAEVRRKLTEDQILSQAVQQLGQFMQFSFDLHVLLKKAERIPLLRSAMWCYYGYWFEIIGRKLEKNLNNALAKFLDWTLIEKNDAQTHEFRSFVARAQQTLADLTAPSLAAEVQQVMDRGGP
jgi:hypothetical protein